jgi:hypothetical protein
MGSTHSPSRVVQFFLRDISAFLLHQIRDFARLRSSPVPSGLCHYFSMAARPKVLRCRACCAARNTRDTPATY